MALPSPDSKIWPDLITGAKVVEFDFLAVKIFLGTAQRNFKADPGSLGNSAKELFKLLNENSKLPSVQKDIAKLG